MNTILTFYQRWYSSHALSREAQLNFLSEESVQDIFHDPLLNFCPANLIKCPLSFWISWQYDSHSDEHHSEREWRRRKTLQRYSGVYIIDILTEIDAVFYVLQNTFITNSMMASSIIVLHPKPFFLRWRTVYDCHFKLRHFLIIDIYFYCVKTFFPRWRSLTTSWMPWSTSLDMWDTTRLSQMWWSLTKSISGVKYKYLSDEVHIPIAL